MPSISALSPYYYKSFHPLKNDDKISGSSSNGHQTYTNANQPTQSLFRLVLQSQVCMYSLYFLGSFIVKGENWTEGLIVHPAMPFNHKLLKLPEEIARCK